MQIVLSKINAQYINLGLSTCFGLLLLVLRMKLTDSFFYLFLLWNLFLASVPYLITQVLRNTKKVLESNLLALSSFLTWLLFLPNSPYIITDFIHIRLEGSSPLWLDLILVFVFAINGLLLGLLSLLDMFALLKDRFDRRCAHSLVFVSCILSGYGIYLGRFLRFNSWDILTKPIILTTKIFQSLVEIEVWGITMAFGGLLWILFRFLQAMTRQCKN
ncbi:DUF1361 domain-containing protein [Ulvibacterium sp.]|uniref:DUF1361 domain-containing protein n=1 Tax=Ulvibacterium sp. TaxID=2665914 RepID=UPI00260A9E63|nr:DUF1361 domain-containing protein [Ulvibacterium sp.]